MSELESWHEAWQRAHNGEPMILRGDRTSGDIYRWDGGVFVNITTSHRDWYRVLVSESGWTKMRATTVQDLWLEVWATAPALEDGDDHKLGSPEPRLNMRNGVLDLHTGKLRPHGEPWATTNQIPWDYIEDEELVAKDTAALDWFLQKATDKETAEFIWRLLGYIAAGGNPDQKLVILQGPGGSGKGTLQQVVGTLVGDANRSSLSLGKVGGRFTTRLLHRKTVNISGDVAGGRIPQYGEILSLTGGDPVHADRKGTDGFDFAWDGVLLIATNDVLTLPKGVSSQTGWWRRAMYVDMNHPATEGEKSSTHALLAKIAPNPAAVATRAAKAVSEALQEGKGQILQPSPAMEKAAAAARLTGDTVADWALDRLERAPGKHAEGGDLIRDFRLWCQNYGHDYPHGARRFYADLEVVLEREELGRREADRTSSSRTRFIGVKKVEQQENFRSVG